MKVVADTLSREGKAHKAIAKKAVSSHSAELKHVKEKLSGRKRSKSNRDNCSIMRIMKSNLLSS